MRRISIFTLAVAVCSVAQIALQHAPAWAEDWPQRNVRIITPFPAGTGGDLAARLFAERLTSRG